MNFFPEAFHNRFEAPDLPLPPVNLGETSFQDGIAFPSWLVEETFVYYDANGFTDLNGKDIPGSATAWR